ncbi:MAG: hypothetical protein AMJ65_15725 [Phycisphaerae bacterium SG8_4]|nr:MAG: hypothetical protein AMJ65_15725 [Phycisphaerae bacterium SG8_4]
MLSGFGRSRKIASNRYVEYLSESDPANPCKDVVGSSLLGSDTFVKWIKSSFLSGAGNTHEIPELKQLKPRPSVELIVERVSYYFQTRVETILKCGSKCNQARDIAIYLSRELSGQTCQSLGEMFGHVSGAAITMRHKHIEKDLKKNRRLKQNLQKMREQIVET